MSRVLMKEHQDLFPDIAGNVLFSAEYTSGYVDIVIHTEEYLMLKLKFPVFEEGDVVFVEPANTKNSVVPELTQQYLVIDREVMNIIINHRRK